MSALLGEVVAWSMRQSETQFSDVMKALEVAGLDPAEAKELSPRSAWTRATREMKENRTIDKIDAKGGLVKFQFTHKALEHGRFEFDYELTVTLDCDTGKVTCDEKPEFAKHAEELLVQAMARRNASDITRLVQRLFEKHADLFPIVPDKGVAYFVPDKHKEFTAKVERFLNAMGGSLHRLPVPKGTDEGNRSVKEAVNSGLEALLKELNDSVAEWDGDTRPKTMERAVDKFQAIAYKVDAYADYLASSQDALKAKLEAAKRGMMEKITAASEPAAV
jgi:hypothetical protein